MATLNWQLQTPLDAIIFDCDGTLSDIEGIDELANKNGVGKEVSALTADAMGKSGLNLGLYKKRLDLVRPTREQVFALGMEYYAHRIPDSDKVLSVLKRLNKTLYIISAGLTPAVTIFGSLLQIPQSNIFAVNLQFNDQGQFLDFDHQSPLVTPEGKRLIVTQLRTRHENLAYLGDGLNDYAVYDLVTRFIGYGGIFYRENIAALCAYYIKTQPLTSLLPLVLTESEYNNLLPPERVLYDQGLEAIQEKKVIVPV